MVIGKISRLVKNNLQKMRWKNWRTASVLCGGHDGRLLAVGVGVPLLVGAQLCNGLTVHVQGVVSVEVLLLHPDEVVAVLDLGALVVDPLAVHQELVLVVALLQVHDGNEVLRRPETTTTNLDIESPD